MASVCITFDFFENNSSDSTSIFNQLASNEHNAVIKQDTQREI